MDYKQCLERAKRVIETDIEYNVSFEVKSLFPLHEWESWSKNYFWKAFFQRGY